MNAPQRHLSSIATESSTLADATAPRIGSRCEGEEAAYRSALDAHHATAAWLTAHQELTANQRQTVDDLLELAVPGTALERIDDVIGQAKALVEAQSAN